MDTSIATPTATADAPAQHARPSGEHGTGTRVLLWTLIVAIVLVLAVAALALLQGLAQIAAGTWPLLVLAMVAWLAALTGRVLKLERRLREKGAL